MFSGKKRTVVKQCRRCGRSFVTPDKNAMTCKYCS